jgi:hypothetical protein
MYALFAERLLKIPYFKVGLKAIALLAGKLQGVVVQIGAKSFWLGSS